MGRRDRLVLMRVLMGMVMILPRSVRMNVPVSVRLMSHYVTTPLSVSLTRIAPSPFVMPM